MPSRKQKQAQQLKSNIKKAMLDKGLTQAMLAKRIGITPSGLSYYMANNTLALGDKLSDISVVLNVSLSDLFMGV